MRIRWTPAAANDLEQIGEYLAKHQPHLAHSTIVELYDTARTLKTSPNRGRPGREECTRELIHTRLPYIIVYRVKEQAIELLRIYHSARQRP
jgi:toxin ParE1/3/4